MPPELPALTGTHRLVQVGEIARDQILAGAAEFARELKEQWESARSDERPELMRQLKALEAVVGKTSAAWWVARRNKTLAEIIRDGPDGSPDRRCFY